MRSWLVVPIVVAPFLCAAPASAQHPRPKLARANEVYVLIDGPKAAVLERQDRAGWVGVCNAPCDRPFALGVTYRIAGEDVRESEPFVLEGKTGSTVTLHVSEAKRSTGVTLVEGGIIVAILGGLTLFGGVFGTCAESSGSQACSNSQWLTYTGGAVAAVGVVGIVTGIVLMVQGSHASVTATIAKASPASLPESAPVLARFRFDAAAPPPRAPLAPTTPIFTLTF